MSAALVEARGVTRILPGPLPVTLVREIDLAVSPGEFLAITGPSGSGKSSLLYLLGLLDEPTSGDINFDGQPTRSLSPRERARMRLLMLGFVFQFHFLLPEFSALHNVLIPMQKRGGQNERRMRERAAEILTGLGLRDCLHKTPDKMSGGQRQRAAIARALANDPRILLADEPTGNLDTENARIVFDIFADLAAKEGRAVITVTHDLELAAHANRRVHLVDGRIVSDGPQTPTH